MGNSDYSDAAWRAAQVAAEKFEAAKEYYEANRIEIDAVQDHIKDTVEEEGFCNIL